MKIYKTYKDRNKITLYNGSCKNLLKLIPDESIDLIMTSPPYCMKKAYEDPKDDIETFKAQHEEIFDDLYRILKIGGSLCWQVGYHISSICIIPLDYIVYNVFTSRNENLEIPLVLRNRIIWTFGHGLNSTKRFSGRHETILWFSKGANFSFDLDSIRVPQKYPGKQAYKGPNKGQLSGHPLGKNPSDVWEIPNVKANHIEKTEHPCQFPVAIPQRFIKSLVPDSGIVLDPFMGSGTTGVAAVLENRRFIGSELLSEYHTIAKRRVREAINGEILIRPDVPVYEPNLQTAVARLPEEFKRMRRQKWQEAN